MINLYDVLLNVKDGWILKIDKSDRGYIIKYDGKVFKDVFQVNISNFLELRPKIRELIDNSDYYYQLSYNYVNKMYASSIRHDIECNVTGKLISEVVDDKIIESCSLYSTLCGLDIDLIFSKCEKVKKIS